MLVAAALSCVIVVAGDSLSSGYGVSAGDAWPALLQRRLEMISPRYRVVNVSANGQTTARALSQLDRELITYRPAIVILELGGVDGLSQVPIRTVQSNLAELIRVARSRNAATLLVGMQLPGDYGSYAEDFREMYVSLSRAVETALVPFLLQGVATNPGLMQPDGLHPNSKAQQRLLLNVWDGLSTLLRNTDGCHGVSADLSVGSFIRNATPSSDRFSTHATPAANPRRVRRTRARR
jgi:acyl-CoA thioesterase I